MFENRGYDHFTTSDSLNSDISIPHPSGGQVSSRPMCFAESTNMNKTDITGRVCVSGAGMVKTHTIDPREVSVVDKSTHDASDIKIEYTKNGIYGANESMTPEARDAFRKVIKQQLLYSFIAAALFAILSMPATYQAVSSLSSGLFKPFNASGQLRPQGPIVHSIVFGLIVFGLMRALSQKDKLQTSY